MGDGIRAKTSSGLDGKTGTEEKMLKKNLFALMLLVGVGCAEEVTRTQRGTPPTSSATVVDGAVKAPAIAKDAGVPKVVDSSTRPLDASLKAPDAVVLPVTTVPAVPACVPPLSASDAGACLSQQ